MSIVFFAVSTGLECIFRNKNRINTSNGIKQIFDVNVFWLNSRSSAELMRPLFNIKLCSLGWSHGQDRVPNPTGCSNIRFGGCSCNEIVETLQNFYF